MSRVVHCKRDDFDVYVGRGSKWGNPFKIGEDGTREEVIEKYEKWLDTQKELLKAIPELRGKVLGCWCSPRRCHGDVLVKLVDDFERVYDKIEKLKEIFNSREVCSRCPELEKNRKIAEENAKRVSPRMMITFCNYRPGLCEKVQAAFDKFCKGELGHARQS